MIEILQNYPHKRLNILTNEWVLVSPHRTKRPWLGKKEEPEQSKKVAYDPNCYLCPENKRTSGEQNPKYKDVYVFENDFAALHLSDKNKSYTEGLLNAQTEEGICRVICFSPDHSKTLANMEVSEITKVIELWQAQYSELALHPTINHIQIFENKGAVMGCSNPHPHGQIWSQSSIPNEVLKKDKQQKIYFQKNKRSILSDYSNQELAKKERVVYENNNFLIVVPFWAVWPYETMIIPKEHQSNIC